CGFFAVDEETLDYLKLTGRDEAHIELVRNYLKENNLFFDPSVEPKYTDDVDLDLSTDEPCIAGSKRTKESIKLSDMKTEYKKTVTDESSNHRHGLSEEEFDKTAPVEYNDGETGELKTGDLVIAAITSCTNTTNPYVMLGAGLIAKKAVEKGLTVPKYV